MGLFSWLAERKAVKAIKNAVIPFLVAGAVWKDWNTDNAVREGYKASTYVYKAIQRKSSAVISAEWKAYYMDKDGEKVEVPETHELARLLKRPNRFTDQGQFFERITQFLELGGNAPIVKFRGVGNRPIELWIAPPAHITPMADDEEYIKGYHYQNHREDYIIPTGDVIHIQYPDPSNPYWGMSPLQAVAHTVDTDNEAVAYNKIAMQNRAVIDGVMTTDEKLNKTQYDEAIEKWREQKTGSENARKTMFLGGGFKFQPMALSPVEMDFIQSRKMTREEITAAFGVPLILLGITEGSTYANYAEARRSFWEDTVIPDMERVKSYMNLGLAPEFTGPNGEELFIDYDLTNVPAMQENENEKLDKAQKLIAMGYSQRQVNQRLNLGFDDNELSEVQYMPSNLVPVSMAKPDPLETNPPPGSDDDPDDDVDLDEIEEALQDMEKGIKSLGKSEAIDRKHRKWMTVERKRMPFDAAFQRAVKERFADERAMVEAKLRGDGITAATKVVKSKTNRKKWGELYDTEYRRIIATFGSDALSEIKSLADYETKDDDLTFDPYSLLIRQFISSTSGMKITKILDTTREAVAETLAAVDDGASIDALARELHALYEEFSLVRSYTIARTETAAASNYGIFAAGQQVPFDLDKEWISSKDDRVRDSHRIDEIVPHDEPFSNGLMYPGDPDGAAGEVILCRCSLAYIRANRLPAVI